MINLLLCCSIFSVNIVPQNVFWDHYTIIPPLGQIKSLATSPFHVYAISDNYLLFLNKQTLNLEKTFYFDQEIDLVGYDGWYNDLWISQVDNMIRFTIASYSTREYAIPDKVNRFGIDQDYVYLASSKNYSLNKRTGEVKITNSFPENIKWYKKISGADIRNYAFLTPYYYYDEPSESQAPFYQFPITALYDDGMDLYVGTDGYGILKYNKVSWQKQRVTYGPLDSRIKRIRKFDNKIYFVSPSGISYYIATTGNWKYQRFTHRVVDLLPLKNHFIISFENRVSRIDGGIAFTLSNFPTDILSLGQDEECVYVGTRSGLFKIIKGTDVPIPFGPDRYSVHAVYPTADAIFVCGDFAVYKYNRKQNRWSKVLNYGVKDIVELKDELYLLGVNNQLIKYHTLQGDVSSADTNWILLPYFNIYDIDTDGEVLYCASYAGIYYYEPDTELYKVIYNLPRVKYDYIFVVDENIVTVSNKVIYRLPIEYRD